MSDLTDHVADALFQTELPLDPGTDSYLGRPAATHLATVALQAARAQGWRIVKTGPPPVTVRYADEMVAITEEWTR